MASPHTTPTSMSIRPRRTSDRSVSGPTEADADDRHRIASSTSYMRGMRRLEMRRGMEESHFLAQKARVTMASVIEPPVDLRLLDYVLDYDRNLMCPICRCPFVDPVVLSECDHCFCRDCLSQTWTGYHPGGPRGNCPTCRRDSRLAPKSAVSKILVNILDDLVVRCPKHEDGCTAEIKRGEVTHHVELYCGYPSVRCPRPDCEQPIRRKDASVCLHYSVACIDCHNTMFVNQLEDHWARECPDRKVDCPSCEQTVYYRTLDSHVNTVCPAITVPCPGSPYGCVFRSKRGELEAHSKICVLATLAPTFAAQQRRIDEQEESQKALLRKLAVFEQGFEKLQNLVSEGSAPDMYEPTNPADPERIPLTLESRTRRPEYGHTRGEEELLDHAMYRERIESSTSVLPDLEFSSPPSGRASRLSQQQSRLSYRPVESHARQASTSGLFDASRQPQSQDLQDLELFMQSPPRTPREDSSYVPSPIQHLLSLHESLRDEVTRIAAALHDLDGRHSMLIFNENLRLKEDMAFLNAQVSGIGRQVNWLTNTTSRGLQMAQQQRQGQSSRSDDDTDGEQDRAKGMEGSIGMQNAVTALRGAARMVNLNGGSMQRAGSVSAGGNILPPPRRQGSDEGRTKL